MKSRAISIRRFNAAAPHSVYCVLCVAEWQVPASGMVNMLKCCGTSSFRWDDTPHSAYDYGRQFVIPLPMRAVRELEVRELEADDDVA